MVAVLVALPVEAVAASYVPMGLMLILIWAATEEILKLLFSWVSVLRLPTTDEPIDIPIYLITTALGFSAVENTFFLFNPIVSGRFFAFLASGDLRFIGATLIHVLASSIVGTALAFAYYRSRSMKILYGGIGVILAIALHAIFNSLILSTGGQNILIVFLGIWVGIVFILLAMERVKGIRRPRWWQRVFVKK
jgi:RsiW-degrading membrane proteinase PrsW (M82 family)